MNDRRGHRKLRLCSNKYFVKRKYFPKTLVVSIPRRTISVLRVSIPVDLLPFRVSLPLSTFTESSVPSLEILHERVQRLGTLSKGSYRIKILYFYRCTCFRVESYDTRGNSDSLSDCFY